MFPPGFLATLAKTIRAYGEPVEFTPQEPPGAAAVPVRGVVARPGQVGLVGDVTQEVLAVWVYGGDLPSDPVRFDRLLVDGQTHAIERSLPHHVAGGIVWELQCAG